MLKNVKRFVETFKNYASYIHNFSWTDNFQNPRKEGKKEKKKLALEAIFRGYSIKKVFLKISQNSLENTCARQKQPFRGVLSKRNSEKIYRRAPMPKCDFNKVALQLYWNHILVWVFSCELAAYFQNFFS